MEVRIEWKNRSMGRPFSASVEAGYSGRHSVKVDRSQMLDRTCAQNAVIGKRMRYWNAPAQRRGFCTVMLLIFACFFMRMLHCLVIWQRVCFCAIECKDSALQYFHIYIRTTSHKNCVNSLRTLCSIYTAQSFLFFYSISFSKSYNKQKDTHSWFFHSVPHFFNAQHYCVVMHTMIHQSTVLCAGYGSCPVCVCVCLSVCLSVPANLQSQATRRPNSDTNGLSATWTLF